MAILDLHILRKYNICLFNKRVKVILYFIPKGWLPTQQNVKYNTDRPDIIGKDVAVTVHDPCRTHVALSPSWIVYHKVVFVELICSSIICNLNVLPINSNKHIL